MVISKALYSSRSEEWGTPSEVFDPLNREFNFTLDGAASEANSKLPRWLADAFSQPAALMRGERVWLNPPYGRRIGEWMAVARRWAEHGALVVCLVHARTDTKWWHEHVQDKAEVRFLRGRVRFVNEHGMRMNSAPFPSAVVIYKPVDGR